MESTIGMNAEIERLHKAAAGNSVRGAEPKAPSLMGLQNAATGVRSAIMPRISELEGLYDAIAAQLGMESHYDRPQTASDEAARVGRPERMGFITDELENFTREAEDRIMVVTRLFANISSRLD